jgi:transposase
LRTWRARRYRQHSAADKVAILRQVLLEGQAVSKVHEEHDLSPTLFYSWQKQFFENGAAAFAKDASAEQRDLERKVGERRVRCPRTRASTSRRMRRTRGDLRSAHEGLPRALIGFGGWRRLRLTAGRRGLRVDSDRGGGRPDTYQGITNVDMPSLSPQNLACPR